MQKPLSEHTPLSQDAETGNMAEYDEELAENYSLWDNPRFRWLVYTLCALIGLPLIWFLIVVLPNEGPTTEEIRDLALAAQLPVYLHPVVNPAAAKMGSLQHDLQAPRDPDDPIRKVPNIAKWGYLGKKTSLFKHHSKKLGRFVKGAKPMKREILIGDIHGSYAPLMKLLKRIKYDSKYDRILMLGDFVAKGKHSLEVLDWAVKEEASCVLGNHEMEVLKRYAQYHGLPKLSFVGRHTNSSFDVGVDEAYDLDDLMRIAKRLTPKHIEYLRECPLIEELGPVPHYTNRGQSKLAELPAHGYAAHAGLLWNVKSIEKQSPTAVTTMRNLLPPDWKKPTEDRGDKVDGVKSVAWTKKWNAEQRKEVAKTPVTPDTLALGKKVYYGHDAHRGLTLKEYSTGLDSGCVYGLALSCEILWAEVVNDKQGERIVYRSQLVQVNC